MAATSYTTITLSHHPLPASSPYPPESIAIVTLNRPHALNAFTKQMCIELVSAFSQLSSDSRVRAIVFTGSGTRAFCAGADLKSDITGDGEVLTSTGGIEEHRDEGGQVSLAIHRCTKPVIAAIVGAAVGVGITMTLPCTLRITHRTAKIAFPFVRRGLVPEACSSFFLPRLIGHSRALRMVSTGETATADSPLLDGLFAEVVDQPEQVLPKAFELAEVLATHTSAVSSYLARMMLWRGPASPEEAHLLESRLLAGLFEARDKKEGVEAFLQKRNPVYRDAVGGDLPLGVPWWTEKAKL